MQKEKRLSKKLPLLYGEKFPFCSGVFQNSLHLVYICFRHNKKIPLYNTEKNSSFVDVFLEKIFDLVLKFTRLSIAMLFVLWNYDIIITLRYDYEIEEEV